MNQPFRPTNKEIEARFVWELLKIKQEKEKEEKRRYHMARCVMLMACNRLEVPQKSNLILNNLKQEKKS